MSSPIAPTTVSKEPIQSGVSTADRWTRLVKKRAIRQEVDQGGDPQASKTERRAAETVADVIEAFRSDRVASKRPATRKAYRHWLAHLERHLGSKKIASVTQKDVERMKSRERLSPTDFKVSKLMLVSRLQAAMHSGQLRIAKGLAETQILPEELADF